MLLSRFFVVVIKKKWDYVILVVFYGKKIYYKVIFLGVGWE